MVAAHRGRPTDAVADDAGSVFADSDAGLSAAALKKKRKAASAVARRAKAKKAKEALDTAVVDLFNRLTDSAAGLNLAGDLDVDGLLGPEGTTDLKTIIDRIVTRMVDDQARIAALTTALKAGGPRLTEATLATKLTAIRYKQPDEYPAPPVADEAEVDAEADADADGA